MANDEKLQTVRHSCAHVMAEAVLRLYPGTKIAIGPAIDNGFYYDFDFPAGTKFTETDFPTVEKEMRRILSGNHEFVRKEVSRDEALKLFADQPYKIELINELPEDEKITFYDMGDLFTDLCKGPHVKDLSETGPFKLIRIAGAYWRGDEKRPMLTRIYGVAFATEEELNKYLEQQEEARRRDHRKLGKELDLFCFSDLVGAGLPLFTPRGTELRELMANYSLSLRGREGFKKVWTPHITKTDLSIVNSRMFQGYLNPGYSTIFDFIKLIPHEYFLCTTTIKGNEIKNLIKTVQANENGFLPTSGLKQFIKIKNGINSKKEVVDVKLYSNDNKVVEIEDEKEYTLSSNNLVLSEFCENEFALKDTFNIIKSKVKKGDIKCSNTKAYIEIMEYLKNKGTIDINKDVDMTKKRIVILKG